MARKLNPWMTHVMKTMRHMKSKGTYKPGKGMGQVIAVAKKSFRHHRRGGGDEPEEVEEMPVSHEAGRRVRHRRGGADEEMEAGRRRTRRHSRRR